LKKGEEKIIRIKNTLHLDEVYISQAILKTVLDSKSIEIIKENVNLFESDTEFAPF
jgi:hypothetical protein